MIESAQALPSCSDFERDGYSVHGCVLEADMRQAVLEAFEHVLAGGKLGRVGERNALANLVIARLACSSGVRALVEPVLGVAAFAFRATLFDKTQASNWPVAFHQDRVIPVAERIDVDGYRQWSRKPDGWYVEPPPAVQADCLAVRVDLDGSGQHNGGLRLLAGSHGQGVLDPAQILEVSQAGAEVCPEVVAGGALRMRPLIVHRSARTVSPARRRIVHLEFARGDLPGGLQFVRRVSPHLP